MKFFQTKSPCLLPVSHQKTVVRLSQADFLQYREVEFINPVFFHKATQQIRHHFNVGKQQLITVIVIHLSAATISLEGTQGLGREHLVAAYDTAGYQFA